MSLTPSMIDAMVQAGCTAEQLAAVMKADIADREAMADERRAKDAERQRRKRSNEDVCHDVSRDVTPCHADITDVTVTPLPLSSPQTPLLTPTPENKYTRARKGARLDANFSLPTDWRDWAIREKNWSQAEASAEGEAFRDFWHAKAGRDATKLDWEATWRNWVRNSRRKAEVRAKANGLPW